MMREEMLSNSKLYFPTVAGDEEKTGDRWKKKRASQKIKKMRREAKQRANIWAQTAFNPKNG